MRKLIWRLDRAAGVLPTAVVGDRGGTGRA